MKALYLLTLALLLAGCAYSPHNPLAVAAVDNARYWGDSLTAGCEDGTSPGCSYPYQFGKMMGAGAGDNEGIGGQTSTQIAVRMGAVATNVTGSFTIPASGSVSNVSFKIGYEPCFNGYPPNSVEGSIGGISVYCQDSGDHLHYTLTRVTAGSAQAVNAGDAWTPVLPPGALSGMNFIWAGRNNLYVCPPSGVTVANCQVAIDVAAMVAKVRQSSGRYIVLTILNGEFEPVGSWGYNVITAINSWIMATYPNNSYDIRSALVSAYNPANPMDMLDHASDIPSYSLRAQESAIAGSLTTAVTSTTRCDINFGLDMWGGAVVRLDSEYIYIAGGPDGSYTCTRGYAGSPAATHNSGAAFSGTDPLHLSGYGTTNALNPNGPGYTFVAKMIFSNVPWARVIAGDR